MDLFPSRLILNIHLELHTQDQVSVRCSNHCYTTHSPEHQNDRTEGRDLCMREQLVSYHPQRTLRSTDSHLLVIPRTCSRRYGDRAFEDAAPRLWNSLPASLRHTADLNAFKRQLKTYLFGNTMSS